MTRKAPQPPAPEPQLDDEELESVTGGRPANFIPLPIEPVPVLPPIQPIDPIVVPLPVPPVVELQ